MAPDVISPTLEEVVLDAAEVAAVPAEPMVEGATGIDGKRLWKHGASHAGLLVVAPGAHLPVHSHGMAHHVWVVEGEAHVAGRALGPGSYWFIPPGHPHGFQAGGGGCTAFYLYVRAGERHLGTAT